MGERFGLPAAVFSLKCFAAAMLALYVALSIGLERPYWAFLTSYIVAQPLAGAVISKAVFRLVGTFVGAIAAVVMVPQLVNSPELFALAFAAWLALCVFVSLLDRTPRSYMFVLAGYSACIIALPSVDAPGQIFNVAVLRVQEIGLGILCGSLVHAVVLPGSITGLLLTRVEGILGDAERWSRDAISTQPVPTLDEERRRLAQDVTELHQLSIHLPFDISRQAPRVRVVRALQDQLSMVLPLGAAVQDRLEAFRSEAGTVTPDISALIADVRDWLAAPGDDRAVRSSAAEALIARCATLEPAAGGAMAWREMLRLSLLARLAALIAVHRDCRDLVDQMASDTRQPVSLRAAELIEGRRNRELHRDYAGAGRAAFGAFVTLLAGCALWIGSGWADGSTAVMLAGVFLALFSASDNPIASLKAFMIGTLIASLVGAVYGFAILPQLDGFPMLAAALAPVLLIGGGLMTSPRYGGIALASMMGMGSPALLSATYVNAFAGFANGSLAQLVGIWFAMIMVGLLQSAGAKGAIRRTVRAGWRDIASRANLMSPPDVRGWINRMLDRIGLLAPRLAAVGQDSGQPLYDALRDLLAGVGDYYRGLDPDGPKPAGPALLSDIDAAITVLSANSRPQVSREATLGLVSLRRNLFPAAPGYRRIAA